MPSSFLFNKSATLKRPTRNSQSKGNFGSTFINVKTFKCCIQSSSSAESYAQNQERGTTIYTLLYQPGTTIKHDDRISIDDVTYNVISEPRDLSGYSKLLEVDVILVPSGDL